LPHISKYDLFLKANGTKLAHFSSCAGQIKRGTYALNIRADRHLYGHLNPRSWFLCIICWFLCGGRCLTVEN